MKLVLLDRDGVINHDSPAYVKSAAEFIPIDGSIAAIARLNQAGIQTAVCTNQAGVGRGMLTLADLAAIHRELRELLDMRGAWLDALYYCPHAPEHGCACRKPKPAMLHAAMRALGRRPHETWFIGDSMRDLEAARNAGCNAALVRTGNGDQTAAECARRRSDGPPVFADLAQAVAWLVTA
jgi:D-glycero-D-manno-heptose 1,7-bisphosphate phosphatase